MKIRQDDNLILTNSTNEKKFTIQASAKAFQILSSALYSRKIEAIIRELGCNAADSHIQAGYPELPFVVHLPNSWEPEFYVEDYGIGLDADDVETIYTSYFTSTKTDSNDVTGGFGLGSKTPFSYCDSFNLRTRKNGIEYHFNAYINMQGEPATSLLSQSETTERNGVRVSVPVKLTDYNQFKTDAEKVYKWFTVVPSIIGGNTYGDTAITINNSKAVRLAEEGSFWSEYSKDGWDKNSITAVMGNVAYHVPKVADTFSAHFNPSERKFFENNSLFIQFQIGDLDVAASRETISFDEDTELAFVKRVQEVIANFCKETQDALDSKITTVQDALALVESEVGLWANSMFTYKGQAINEWSTDNFIELIRDHLPIDDYYFARTRKGTVKRHALDYIGGHTFSKLARKDLVVLVGNDKGFQTMARQIVNRSYQNTGITVLFVDVMPDDAVKDTLYEIFGDYLTFELASDLIAADKAKRKAERDRLKALQGPSYRKPTVARIGRDSIRAKVFEMGIDPTSGLHNYTFKEKRVITADDVKDKAYLLLVERYNSADVRLVHPIRVNAEMVIELTTTGEQSLFSFCRNYKIDMVIVIKQETFKKADALIGANAIKDVTTVDADYMKALLLRYSLSAGNNVSIESLVNTRDSDDAPASLLAKVNARVEEYVLANPTCEIAQALEITANLTSSDVYSNIPHFMRDVATTTDGYCTIDYVRNIRATIDGIFESLKSDYPMAFNGEVEDDDTLEDYIYYMDKLRELDLIRKPEPVVEDVKEIEEVVVEDDDFF